MPLGPTDPRRNSCRWVSTANQLICAGHSGWVNAIATTPENPDMILSASRGLLPFPCLFVFLSVSLCRCCLCSRPSCLVLSCTHPSIHLLSRHLLSRYPLSRYPLSKHLLSKHPLSKQLLCNCGWMHSSLFIPLIQFHLSTIIKFN